MNKEEYNYERWTGIGVSEGEGFDFVRGLNVPDQFAVGLSCSVAATSINVNQRKSRRPFIKGPLPLLWMQEACRVNAAPLALFLWYKAGFTGCASEIPLRHAELGKFGIGRNAARRQFKAMVKAQLIRPISVNGGCNRALILNPDHS